MCELYLKKAATRSPKWKGNEKPVLTSHLRSKQYDYQGSGLDDKSTLSPDHDGISGFAPLGFSFSVCKTSLPSYDHLYIPPKHSSPQKLHFEGCQILLRGSQCSPCLLDEPTLATQITGSRVTETDTSSWVYQLSKKGDPTTLTQEKCPNTASTNEKRETFKGEPSQKIQRP